MPHLAALRRLGSGSSTRGRRCVHSGAKTEATCGPHAPNTPAAAQQPPPAAGGSRAFATAAVAAVAVPAQAARGGALAWYARQLERRPLLTKGITSALLAGGADLTCQAVQISQNPGNPRKKDVDLKRTARFALVAAAITTPLSHYWFQYLYRCFGDGGVRNGLRKVTADMLVFAVPYVTLQLTTLYALEALPGIGCAATQQQAADAPTPLERALERMPTVMPNYFSFWGPFQLLNFAVIPVPYQVLFGQSVSFFWSIYLSWATSNAATTADADTEAGAAVEAISAESGEHFSTEMWREQQRQQGVQFEQQLLLRQ